MLYSNTQTFIGSDDEKTVDLFTQPHEGQPCIPCLDWMNPLCIRVGGYVIAPEANVLHFELRVNAGGASHLLGNVAIPVADVGDYQHLGGVVRLYNRPYTHDYFAQGSFSIGGNSVPFKSRGVLPPDSCIITFDGSITCQFELNQWFSGTTPGLNPVFRSEMLTIRCGDL